MIERLLTYKFSDGSSVPEDKKEKCLSDLKYIIEKHRNDTKRAQFLTGFCCYCYAQGAEYDRDLAEYTT